jgi:hypothetical protein
MIGSQRDEDDQDEALGHGTTVCLGGGKTTNPIDEPQWFTGGVLSNLLFPGLLIPLQPPP